MIAPYDIFDFRVSRHRDGPDEILSGYQGHVMADCYSGDMSVVSLVASALRQDLDIEMYLESGITHMLRGTAKTEELLSGRWKATHPEAVRQYREQERRDKADATVIQAARRRMRAELRKVK